MKNKIDTLFETKENGILSVFFTAGYPHLNDASRILKELQENGVDLIEIGIPYSDPLADGPVIQNASQTAIENGMNLELLFKQLDMASSKIRVPLILMGYLNTVIQFGIEKFYKMCSENSVSGVILPDLPLQVFKKEHEAFASKYDIKVIFLITPNTSIERIKQIDAVCTGFIYVVSSNSITGNNHQNFETLEKFYAQLHQIPLKNKTLIGFGINDHASFTKASKLAKGAIIGSAFIKALSKKQSISSFLNSIKNIQTITS
ncbi:MAG: tryptophan synthase subunit alpha [Bacteroidia bacterium]|jgi:tryptophan synthase alpha chain|nr:tryptophan synthase subunit alpha [Sphingobacteriaceae bacterium]MBP9068623.1 tryptophan synthase subunit alpha [Bacteroidia bacterium]